MTVECSSCGKKYRSIARSTWEQDHLGQFDSVPICRRCWDGIVLVDEDVLDDVVCQDCYEDKCPVTKAMCQDVVDGIEEALKECYPSARTVWLPRSDWQTEQARVFSHAGYEQCPESILYDDYLGEYDTCPHKANASL